MSTPESDREPTAREAPQGTPPTRDIVVRWVHSHWWIAIIVVLLAVAASVVGITLSSSGPPSRAYQAGFSYGEYRATDTPAAIVCDPSQVLDFTFRGWHQGPVPAGLSGRLQRCQAGGGQSG